MNLKSGWKTSEFWVMVATMGASMFGLDVNMMTTVVGAAYVASRGIAKMVKGGS